MSLELLNIPAINVEYLYVPDRATPFASTLEAMDHAYRAGKFRHTGLSNFTAGEVDEMVAICTAKGFCKPSVYQGQYNAIVRSGEAQLFPTLRKHGIAFYAWGWGHGYSYRLDSKLKDLDGPAAAGFFTGNHKHVNNGDRFDTPVGVFPEDDEARGANAIRKHAMGQMYASGYLKDNIIATADRAIELVKGHNINGHAGALRWTAYHSKLDAGLGNAIIIAASSVAQLHSNMEYVKQGPLPPEVLEALDKIYWEIPGSKSPYHY
jgi:aflatoxin B1 aldehyde reductase